MEEVWKDVVGFEGLYKISNNGKIISLRYHNRFGINFELTQFNNKGYYRVVLTKNKKSHTYKVHRLVAQAFIPNPNKLPEVNHINGIKNDNRVNNLEWCSHQNNIKHAIKTGLIKTNMEHIKKLGVRNSKIVGQFDKGKLINKYNSVREASDLTGVYESGIYRTCQGKYKSCHNFEWKYL